MSTLGARGGKTGTRPDGPSRAGRRWAAAVVCAGALTGIPAIAAADPPPRPPGRAQVAHHPAARHPGHLGHSAAHGRTRPAHHRPPRTVARCQHDETDQVEEINDDDDLPEHTMAPGAPVPAGICGGQDTELIKRILGLRV